MLRLLLVILLAALPLRLAAQEAGTMIVLDASGSMWGDIGGRTKIEIARETLAEAVGNLPAGQGLGLIVYGATRKGDCADIVTAVPPGPVAETGRRVVSAADAAVPKGKTPITESVRRAAQAVRFNEAKATVVLVTDGIETCDADPCALARDLEREGIDFTAHVVGFGLSAEEGRAVACLADETGGRYIEANDRDALSDALATTLAADPEPDEPDAAAPRDVALLLRDAEGRPVLNSRDLASVVLAGPDGARVGAELDYGREATARLSLAPGEWEVTAERVETAGDNTAYSALKRFTVPEGDGEVVVDLPLRAHLTVETIVGAGEPLPSGETVPSAVAGRAGASYELREIVRGAPAATRYAAGAGGFDEVVAPGRYILRGTFARTITRDVLVEIAEGEHKVVPFDFALSRVVVAALDADGKPVTRQTTVLADGPKGAGFSRGGGGLRKDGARLPFFLPAGRWRINAGQEGGGQRRSEVLVEVPGAGGDLTVTVGEGERLSETDRAALAVPNCSAVGGKTGCLLGTDTAASVPPGTAADTVGEAAGANSVAAADDAQGAGALAGFWAMEEDGPDACAGNVLAIDGDGFFRLRIYLGGATGFTTAVAGVCAPGTDGAARCTPVALSQDRRSAYVDRPAEGAPEIAIKGGGADSAELCVGAEGCKPLVRCQAADLRVAESGEQVLDAPAPVRGQP
ncbi:vWA domain-containing protein [Acuticoccus sediminis]|uniref:vWA domain-containing protein n=1 Tax=Acuticoccus sediminis TaxID=2184697 RepID=UPI001CFE55EE|nr:VWA domain-containing protein [Acuticoccus sediminis]